MDTPEDTGTGEVPTFPDRLPGDRTPLSMDCDPVDPNRCLLPFPSNTFTDADSTSATGLRVSIEAENLMGTRPDDATYLNLGDGFSRLSPVLTMFAGGIDPLLVEGRVKGSFYENAPIRVVNVTPDHPEYGQDVPLWLDRVEDSSDAATDLLLAYGLVPFAEGADHLVFITDDLADRSGAPHAADHLTRVALGLEPAENEDEARLYAYHAPNRAVLTELGVEAESVIRMWDFTTRTNENTWRRLLAMMDRAESTIGDTTIRITGFAERSDPGVAGIVIGEIDGVPNFLGPEGRFIYDDQGLPIQQGTHTANFRVAIPETGWVGGELGDDYRVALYGHGTGGAVTDGAFDSEITSLGVAKVNLEFLGWTGDDLLFTLSDLLALSSGSEKSTAHLMQAVVDGRAILLATGGPLGEALRADTLAGEPNPTAGRGPVLDSPAWVGGSLGGTMGAIIATAFPEIHYGILNVPAGAWIHLVADSLMYDTAMGALLENAYGSELDARTALAMSQGAWDDVDGAAWADKARADGMSFLLQESIGDPVVPNPGTNILATALGATRVGPELLPIYGTDEAEVVRGGIGITQYRVPDTEPLDIHGFAARDTPAGAAAMEQIFHFMQTAWEGESEIVMPQGCTTVTPDGSCDFTDVW